MVPFAFRHCVYFVNTVPEKSTVLSNKLQLIHELIGLDNHNDVLPLDTDLN